MIILPLTYLGNIEYFSLLASAETVIDVGENYVKQSCRNRCQIMSANGVIPLIVNVSRGDALKTPVKEIRIDYSKRWQHQHWQAIVSSYKNSAFFDFFEEHFSPFYNKKYEFLYDYNRDIIDQIIKLLQLNIKVNYSETYVEIKPGDIDLRSKLLPKQIMTVPNDKTAYYQVFSDKHPFAPNLSVIDLLFNEGLRAKNYLQSDNNFNFFY